MLRLSTAAMLFAVISSASQAQQNGKAELCSTYFQARADWLRTLDGNPDTIQTLERYAKILWNSVPRDDGILKGVSGTSKHNPEIMTTLMTAWAEQGGQLPLCMEDTTCSACTNTLHAVQ